MRILHVVDSLGNGGLETGLVRIIRSLDPTGFEHTVLAIRKLGPLAAELAGGGTRLLCLDRIKPGYQFLVAELARSIRQLKPDVVHSRNWGTIETVVAARLARCRAVIHSEHGFESADTREPAAKRWFRRTAYELAHRVFSVSFQLRDVHAARTGFPSRKIDVIHNGVDTSRYRRREDVRAAMRRELGIAPEVLCIGAVGRLQPVKDHMTLLRAASRLPAGAAWCVLLAGDGSEMAALQAFVRENETLRGRVRFLGHVNDVASLLNAVDVYTLPSLTEGISNSLLEAMASGLPAVATSAGGNVEAILDGRNGLLFPVGDGGALASHLVTLLQNPERRRSLGVEAAGHIRRFFSLEAMVARYELLYRGVAASRAR